MARNRMKMPEDVLRMTVEMRKAYDNPDPRPRLRRGNPKAVSVTEMNAQLRAIRESAGNGSADEMLGSRMNPLVLAAGGTSPVAAAAMTAPAALKAGKDLRDMGVKVPEDPDALFNLAMLGMITRGHALPKANVAKATSMLAGREWRSLSRADKLAIKRDTGLEQLTGSGEWIHETALDPKLKPTVLEKYREWAQVAKDRGHLTALGRYKDITSGGDEYFSAVPSAADAKVSLMPVRLMNRDRVFNQRVAYALPDGTIAPDGKGGFLIGPQRIRLSEASQVSRDPQAALSHEGMHLSHSGWSTIDRYSAPEIEARAVEHRSALSPEERATSLMEDWIDAAPANVRQAAKGGNARGESKSSGVPPGHNAALDGYSGPRIVINPSTFRNEKDSLCVAFNEAFRILMEVNGFDPVAEPTEKQREFFSDTAYADDELQMRRTILARLCTFDTSVTDPTDEQLQEAVEFLDTVLEIGAPQNRFEQQAVMRIRTAISQALESGERVPASQAPAPEGSPEVAAGGAGSSAGGVPEDEEKDSGAEFRENARAQMDEAAKLAQEGPTAEEQKTQAMAGAAGKVAGDDPFGKSEEMKAAAQEAGLKADIAEAQKPENLMQKNGHYVDAQGRVISERAAKALAEQGVRNAAAQDTNNQQQAPTQTASERIGTTSGIKTPGGRELTAGEAAWQARKQASTAAWMQRTGRSGDGVADALAQRDERANNLRQVDNGRRDALGRMLDDRGRVIA